MSTQSLDAGLDESSGPTTAKLLPGSLACNGCRRAKLRCSRDRPSCSHCRKTGLECSYETKRVKPGLKAGAVENLHRRLDAVEKAVYERDAGIEQRIATSSEGNAYNILALLAKELPKLIDTPRHERVSCLDESADVSHKRRRLEHDDGRGGSTSDDCPPLPAPEIMEKTISSYFTHIHPWIPMIHQARFRRRLGIWSENRKLQVVLRSMIVAASKFSCDESLSAEIQSRNRKWVVWKAMDEVSPESLQSLIILAFADIGDGNTSKAWSLIGSLTRTVEYSQLTQEQEGSNQPFCRPYYFLDDTDDWTEIEERRRIFWNVFNLDRFCSISMGWNTSLTSDDVHRRLPCDGPLWRKCKSVITPYFGIWDKSAGRIGNPIAFLPQYHSPEPSLHGVNRLCQLDKTSSEGENQNLLTDTTIGAFAYCVEATESMSRITSYFLQQKINLRDQREINSWLTRFKELDLRLVHWKMLLPQKWKANMERQSTLMDPNLTTAHVTHNASMILLHQLIAYPPSSWGFRNRLPSIASAEACQTAGIEIARITQNYLNNSNTASPIGPQYAFCLFIAGRMLLIHWKYKVKNNLPEAFWSVVNSLVEMSRRWTAFSKLLQQDHDLYAIYTRRLKELYQKCAEDSSFEMNVMDYTNDINYTEKPRRPEEAITIAHPRQVSWSFNDQPQPMPEQMSGLGLAMPISPEASMGHNVQGPSTIEHLGSDGIPNSLDLGDFNTIPHMMLDQQFMNMDRVIAFDDGSMFAATMEPGTW